MTTSTLLPDVAWHGVRLNELPWSDPDARIRACTLAGRKHEEEHLHMLLNMSKDPVEMELPKLPGRVWYRAIDTGQVSPAEILEADHQPPVKKAFYRVLPRSVVVLESR